GDTGVQKAGHQLAAEHRVAPMRVPVARAAPARRVPDAVLHRHLRSGAVRLTTSPVERRDGPHTDEVRVCAPRTRRPHEEAEGRPDGAVTEDMAHLVENDLAEVTVREQAGDVRRIEAHDADSRSVARSADDTGTRLAEHLAGPVDRIELDENDDVINRLVDYRRAGPACSSPEGHCDVGDVAVDQPLPLHF